MSLYLSHYLILSPTITCQIWKENISIKTNIDAVTLAKRSHRINEKIVRFNSFAICNVFLWGDEAFGVGFCKSAVNGILENPPHFHIFNWDLTDYACGTICSHDVNCAGYTRSTTYGDGSCTIYTSTEDSTLWEIPDGYSPTTSYLINSENSLNILATNNEGNATCYKATRSKVNRNNVCFYRRSPLTQNLSHDLVKGDCITLS